MTNSLNNGVFQIVETLNSGDSYNSSIELDEFSNIYECLICFFDNYKNSGHGSFEDERNWLLERAKFHGIKKNMSVSKFLKEKDIRMYLCVEVFFINDDSEEHLFMFDGEYDYDQDEIVDLDIELITFDEFVDENKRFFKNIDQLNMEKLKSIWPI